MLPPQGAAPQQQVQGGIPAAPQAPKGAAPQSESQGKSNLTPDQLNYLRKDPEVAQVLQLFIGQPVPLEKVPEFLLTEVAGMVHKLGVNGAVAMLNKAIPAEVKKQMVAEVSAASKTQPQGVR